jgi:CHAT domain-containing protein
VLKLSERYRKKITDDTQRNSFFDAEQEVYDIAIQYESSVENDYVKALEYSEQSRARSLLDEVQRGAGKDDRNDLRSPSVTLPLTVAEIQKRMPAGSQIVQYAVLTDKMIIWVVTQTSVEHEEVPTRADELTEKVKSFLDTVASPGTAESFKEDRSSELYGLLIRPVERHLEKNRFLVIIPDKILNYLPFATLISPTSRYLIEDYNLGAAASGTLFVKLSAAAEQKLANRDELLLSVGDPTFNGDIYTSLRNLPSMAEESRAVAGLYPNHKLLIHDQATESTTRRELEKSDVAHLAMHFVLNEQSEMLSGFPLAAENSNNTDTGRYDGFLQSREICRLNLHRMRLIVLSGCQTGIERQYRGEGAVGAARPFFIAGVPMVVASLWPVDSDASAELMVRFHRYRRNGLQVAQALRRSQVEMIRAGDSRYRHPYYWAPFVAMGGLANY